MTVRTLLAAAVALVCCAITPHRAQPTPTPHPKLPTGFVYLSDVAPSIVQDVRYGGYHNFVGSPIPGYDAPVCILTERAAQALAKAQRELEDADLTLRVYDCYRPRRSVAYLIAWTRNRSETMKAEFYPDLSKSQLIPLGYITEESSHSRGSSVDLTIERLPPRAPQPYSPGNPLRSCTAPYFERYNDGSLNMGTTFDCMDPLSHYDADVGNVAESHRKLLRGMMEKYGFDGVPQEWWHFTLRDEPFAYRSFDFPVSTR